CERPLDTGAYNNSATLAYCAAGGYGSTEMEYQLFVRAFRPQAAGTPNVGGFAAGLTVAIGYDFQAGVQGWTPIGAAVIAAGQGFIRHTYGSSGDRSLYSPTPLALTGANGWRIRLRMRRIDAAPAANWLGQVYYSVSGSHGFSGSYMKSQGATIPTALQNEWFDYEFTMNPLTFGGTDFIDSVITQVRLDLTLAAAAWEIETVQFGVLPSSPHDGFGTGSLEYVAAGDADPGIIDADIYAAIERVRAAGVTVWLAIENP
ncbi:MAG: hypothetical protein ABW199_09300, partial [Caulobacterales bacterium]